MIKSKKLIKQILAVLLSFVMVFGIVMIPEKKIKAEGHTHSGYTAWTSSTSLPTSGKYYLTKDVTLSERLFLTGDLSLCLNDHCINLNGAHNIRVKEGHTFNLYDCGTTKRYYTISNNIATGISTTVTDENHSFTGGYITGGLSTDASCEGFILVEGENSVFNMYGGTIIGNSNVGYGSGAYLNYKGKFNMYGGSFIGNYQKGSYGSLYCYGGAVTNYNGYLNIYGGTIKHNSSLKNGSGITSGASQSGSHITSYISNCNIVENYAKNGYGVRVGGVYVGNYNLTIGDNVTITGNVPPDTIRFDGNNRSGCGGVYVEPGSTCTLDGSNIIIKDNKDGYTQFLTGLALGYNDSQSAGIIIKSLSNSDITVAYRKIGAADSKSGVFATLEGTANLDACLESLHAELSGYNINAASETELEFNDSVPDATFTCNFADSDNKTAYTGEEITGVVGENVTITGDITATDAGIYTAKATPQAHHSWADGSRSEKTITWTIDTLPVTLTDYSVSDKVYDGNETTTITGDCTLTGVVDSDAGKVSFATLTATFDDADVGTDKNVTISGTLEGTAANNYTFADVTTTADITKRPVTITANNQSVVLNHSIETGTSKVSVSETGDGTGLVSGHTLDSINLESSSTANTTTEGTITPSVAKIKAGSTDVTSNYEISYVPGTLTVTKDNPVVTAPSANNLTYTGTEQVLITEGSTTGGTLKYSLDQTSWTEDYSAIKMKNAGKYTVYYKVEEDSNYNEVAAQSIDVTIKQKDITISGIKAEEKTYDGNDTATLTYDNVHYGGIVEGDSLTVSAVGSFSDINAGDDKNVDISDITLDGDSVANYKLAAIGQQTIATGKITKRPVTITANNQSVVLNHSIETGTSKVSVSETGDGTGLVSGHTLDSINLESSSTANTTTEGTITPSVAKIKAGSTDVTSNYEISYVPGTLTVTKDNPVVTAPSAKNLTYDGTEQVLITEGSTTGGTLKYSLDQTTWTDDYSDIKMKNAGIYTVYYKVEEDSNYYEVAAQSIDVTIKQKDIIISGIEAEEKIYDKNDNATLVYDNVDYGGIEDGDSLTVSAVGIFSDINAGDNKTVNISDITLAGDSVANYKLATNGQQTTTTATINKRVVGITWGETDFVYDGINHKPEATATNIVEGDTCNVTVSGEQINAGVDYTATAIALSDTNYELPDGDEIVETLFTIAPKAVTDADVSIGHSDGHDSGHYEHTGVAILPEIVITSELVEGEQRVVLADGTDYTLSRDASAVTVGEHLVKIDFKGNYSGTLYGTWYIDAQQITIKADDMSKIYGEDDPDEFTISVDPATADLEGIDISVEREQGEDVGTYAITVTGPEKVDDYEITYETGTFTIEKASATVKTVNKSKAYGDDDPQFTARVTGLKNGDDESVLTYSFDRVTGEDAGTYDIAVSGEAVQGNYNVTYVPGTLTISKRRLSKTPIVLDKMSFKYDGENHSPNPILNGVDYSFTEGVDYEISGETTANDKGKHTITLRGIGNNFTGTVLLDWYITSIGDTTVTYNGQEQTLDYVPEDNVVVTFKQADGNYTSELPKYKNAGSYDIEYMTTVDNPLYPAYSDEETIEVEGVAVLTINPKELTVTAENKSKVFGEQDPEFTFTVNGIVDGETVDEAFTNKVLSRAEGEDVGDYDINRGQLTTNPNYAIGTFNKGKLSITLKQLSVDIFTLKLTSGTDEIEIGDDIPYKSTGWTVTAETGDEVTGVGTITPKYYKVTNSGLEELATGVPTELGEYVVKLDIAEGTNFGGTGSTPLEDDSWRFSIVKGTFPSDLSDDYWPSLNDDFEYNGHKQNLVIAPIENAPTGYKMKYSTDGENWSETIPQGRNSGDYTVYAKYVSLDPEHYEDSEVKTYNVTMAEATNINDMPDADSFNVIYVSEENVSDGKIEGVDDSMEYSTDDGETWTSVGDNQTSIDNLGKGEVLIRTKETPATDTEPFMVASEPVTVTIGVKENQDAPASESFTVTKASSDTATDGTISGVDDTMEYSTDGTNWTSVPENTTTLDNLPKGTYKIRKKGTNEKNPSTAVEIEVGVKTNQTAPVSEGLTTTKASSNTSNDGKIDGVDDTMEYSTDGGETWTKVSAGKTSINELPAGDVKIRYAGTNDKNPSDAITVTIETKQPNSHSEGPSLTDIRVVKASDDETKDGIISGVSDDMEYSTDGGETWNKVPQGENKIENLPSGDILIRYFGNDDINPSPSTTVPIGVKDSQEPLDPSDLRVTHKTNDETDDGMISGVDDTMEYSLDGGQTWNPVEEGKVVIDNLPAGEVQIRYAGTDDKNPSSPIALNVGTKTNQETPVTDTLKVTKASSDTSNDGTINGVNDSMEYSTDGGQTWTKVPAGKTTINGLPSGEVQIRYAGTDDKNPSSPITLNVGTKTNQGTPDKDKLTVKKASGVGKSDGSISGVDDTMEYSVDGGKTWKQVEKGKTTISGLPVGEIQIRYAGTDDKNAGNTIKVKVEAKEEVVVKNTIKETCQIPYTGEGGGYLIGFSSAFNTNQAYRYEILILDCNLYIQGKDPWIYSTGQCCVEGNTFWTVWQPVYGYYWTLFRLYDEDGNMLDERCYGFANVF